MGTRPRRKPPGRGGEPRPSLAVPDRRARDTTWLGFLDSVIDSWGRTLRLVTLLAAPVAIVGVTVILALYSPVWKVVSGSPAMATLVSVGSNVLAFLTFTAIKKRRELRASQRPDPSARSSAESSAQSPAIGGQRREQAGDDGQHSGRQDPYDGAGGTVGD